MEKLRGWVRRRPILWLVGILIAGFVLGGIGGESGKGGLEDDKTSLESELSSANQELQGAKATNDRVGEELANAEEQLQEYSPAKIREIEAKSDRLIAKAKREATAILGRIESRAEAEEAHLESVRSELGGAEEEAALSIIPANGTFKAEVDYLPGTYRAPGGSGCYWATLNSADPNDIASNELGSGPQIATIETPYFQTSGCGEWERIPE